MGRLSFGSLGVDLLLIVGAACLLLVTELVPKSRPPALWVVGVLLGLSAVADMTTNLFPSGIQTPSGLRWVLFAGLVIYMGGWSWSGGRATVVIKVFLIYTLLLVLRSADGTDAIETYAKSWLCFSMFPIGFVLARTEDGLRGIARGVVALGMVMVVGFLIAQFLRLGPSEYLKDSFYMGGARVQTSYALTLSTLCAAYLVSTASTQSRRLFYGVAGVVCGIVVVVILRRMAIVGLAVGIITYLALMPNKRRALASLLVIAAMLIAAFPLYGDVLLSRYQHRIHGEQVRDLQEEGRFMEIGVVLSDLQGGGVTHAFIGSQIYTSGTYFRVNRDRYPSFGYGRELHMDYSVILHGMGLIGAGLYAALMLLICWQFRDGMRRPVRPAEASQIRPLFWSVLVASLLIAGSDGLTFVGYRVPLMLLLGGCIARVSAPVLVFEPARKWVGSKAALA